MAKRAKRPTRQKTGKFCLWIHRVVEAPTPGEPTSRRRMVCYPNARKLKEAMRAANRFLRSDDEDAFFYDFKSSHFKRKSKPARLSPRERRRAAARNKRNRDDIPF